MMQEISATIKCPRCRRSGIIKVPKEKFDTVSEGGLMKIAFDHGDHVFVVWIDAYGYQRATDVFETIEESTKTEGEHIEVIDIIKLFGEDVFAKILTASVCGYRMFIDMDKRYLRLLDYLITYLLREFPNVVDRRDIAEVSIGVTGENKRLPGENYFAKNIRRLREIDNEKIRILKLKMSIEAVKKVSNEVKKTLYRARRPMSIIDLAKKVKVRDRDLLILAINRALYFNKDLRKFIKEKAHIFSSP